MEKSPQKSFGRNFLKSPARIPVKISRGIPAGVAEIEGIVSKTFGGMPLRKKISEGMFIEISGEIPEGMPGGTSTEIPERIPFIRGLNG